MKQILTIWENIRDSERFDKKVNAAIERGWTLENRMLINAFAPTDGGYAYRVLYAELKKEV